MEIRTTGQFLKDVKTADKQGKSSDKFKTAVRLICSEHPLPDEFRDHDLKGNWAGFRECHIGAGLLLIYRILPEQRILLLVRAGDHPALFQGTAIRQIKSWKSM